MRTTFQKRIKNFINEHPVATKVVILGVSIGLAIIAARSRQNQALENGEPIPDQDVFIPTMVKFIDGFIAYTSPNHTVESLTQDNYDLYK